MLLHVRRVPESSEGNPDLKGDSMKLCSRGELLGVHPKSLNVPHWLRME